jgi:hypothetical protein
MQSQRIYGQKNDRSKHSRNTKTGKKIVTNRNAIKAKKVKSAIRKYEGLDGVGGSMGIDVSKIE